MIWTRIQISDQAHIALGLLTRQLAANQPQVLSALVDYTIQGADLVALANEIKALLPPRQSSPDVVALAKKRKRRK